MIVAAAVMMAGTAVLGCLGLAAVVLWWINGRGERMPANPGIRAAEQQIIEIHRRAREQVMTNLLAHLQQRRYGTARRTDGQYEQPAEDEWQ